MGLLRSATSHPKELEGRGGVWTYQHVPVLLLLHSSIPTRGWRRESSTPSRHQQLPGTPGCCRQGRLGQMTTGIAGQRQGRFAHGTAGKTSMTPYRDTGNASESGGHEGQYDVHAVLSWPHGCLVATVLSSSSYKGCNHCRRSPGALAGSWSGLLLSQGRRWLNLGTGLSPGAQKHLWTSLCAKTGEIQHDHMNPGPSVALGRSRGQATGCHQHP